MSTEDNKAIVRRAIETINQGNVAATSELWTPDLVNHDPNNPQVRVREEYKQWLTGFITAVPGQFSIEDLIAEGEKVVARYIYRGTHQGQWRGVPPTGKPVTITGTVTYRLVDGKLAEIWANHDALSLVQQLGLIPAPGQAS